MKPVLESITMASVGSSVMTHQQCLVPRDRWFCLADPHAVSRFMGSAQRLLFASKEQSSRPVSCNSPAEEVRHAASAGWSPCRTWCEPPAILLVCHNHIIGIIHGIVHSQGSTCRSRGGSHCQKQANKSMVAGVDVHPELTSKLELSSTWEPLKYTSTHYLAEIAEACCSP